MSELSSKDDLIEWVKAGAPEDSEYLILQPATFDINREIIPPGDAKYPDGGIGIRTDDNFFACAFIPWRFRGLDIQTLSSVIWPQHVPHLTYGADYGCHFLEVEIG